MNARLLVFALPLLVWTCATPPSVPTPSAPTGAALVDDDHRLVSLTAFQASSWSSLAKVASWKALPNGVELTLADGRAPQLTFVAPTVVRWWVPAAAGEAPLSPAAQYSANGLVSVKVREAAEGLVVETPSFSIRITLADLSWRLVRGERVVLKTASGPEASGRRLRQTFDSRDQVAWYTPRSSAPALPNTGVKSWITGRPDDEEGGPFATPALFGSGGPLPVALVLDNSYQTYSFIGAETVSLGALNGGLDLLVAAAPQPQAVVEALSSLLGRPALLPNWAHGTALALPEGDSGAFVRKAKLSIQTVAGSPLPARPGFQSLWPLAAPAAIPDLTNSAVRRSWLVDRGVESVSPGTGLSLPSVAGRLDWNARFDDGGRGSPLARMNNQLAGLEAQAVAASWSAHNPGLRPVVLAGSGSWGTIRSALPEVRVTAGEDAALASVVSRSAFGLGTPAIRLDLTPLARPDTRSAAFQSLLLWSLAPVLSLDWGTDPAAFWAGLPEADRKRVKTILDMRSQLKPLLIQAARGAATTGRPAWQPLWFAAPVDAKALVRADEFLLADQLLVAPLVGGQGSRSVYLPGPGVWFDFWSGEEFGGGQTYDLEGRPDRPLLFAKGGAVLPQREAETFDDKDVYNPLTVHVFPGGRGVGTYYLDDGRTQAWASGGYWETRLIYDFGQKDMTLEHQTQNTTGLLRPDPYLLYRIHNVFRPKQVRIDGKAIPLYGDSWGITDTDRSAAWYESDHTLLVKTFKPERDQSIVMSF